MKLVPDVITLVALLGQSYAVIIIPDSVSTRHRTLTYYTDDCTWYGADAVCRANGGRLFLVDDQKAADELRGFETIRSKFSQVFTGMVSHDNGHYYVNDTACRPVNVSNWAWEAGSPGDSDKQCVVVEDPDFLWDSYPCAADTDYVCEYSHYCDFTSTTSVSLVSVPVNNADMKVCQAMCREMIGCFATAPSVHASLQDPSHCLFIVVGISINPMSMLDCSLRYKEDTVTNCPLQNPHDGANPPDCSPVVQESHPGQRHLERFFRESNATSSDCNRTVTISPSPVVETAYVTRTPDVVTAYVTLTPDVVTTLSQTDTLLPIQSACLRTVTVSLSSETAYVTLTPDVVTAYVTLTPDVVTAYVTLTPDVDTALSQTDTLLPIRSACLQTVTVSPSPVVETAYVTLTPDVVSAVSTLTHTMIHTQEVTQTHRVTEGPAPGTAPSLATVCNSNCSACPTDDPFTFTSTFTDTTTVTMATSVSSLCPTQGPVFSNATASSSIVSFPAGNKTKAEALKEMQAVIKALTVDPHNVSRYRRKKESALDQRKSAQMAGGWALALMTLVGLVIVVNDGTTLYRNVKRLREEQEERGNATGGVGVEDNSIP